MTWKLNALGEVRIVRMTWPITDLERRRFLENADQSAGEDACWPWTGAIAKRYPTTYHQGQPRKGHRLAYEMFVGEIPNGHVVHHVCENPRCVNPRHLEAMSNADHLALHREKRRVLKQKTPALLEQPGA